MYIKLEVSGSIRWRKNCVRTSVD